MHRRRLFDTVAVIDWSASATPKLGGDSIWLAVAGGDGCRAENLRTRHEALAAVAALARPGRRSLLGVDFSLGFPVGTASALGLVGSPWAATWRQLGAELTDDDRNRNNRFEVAARWNATIADGPGPFWGCPPQRAAATLTTTKPVADPQWPPEWRHVETVLRAGRHRPFSAWQLLGVGSVGSQSLTGIAGFERLRWSLGERLAIWPFTTGLAVPDDDAELVVAEVWPSLWPVEVPSGRVKDAAQVEATAMRLVAHDRAGTLDGWFTPALAGDVAADVVDEEGWVLGVRAGSPEDPPRRDGTLAAW